MEQRRTLKEEFNQLYFNATKRQKPLSRTNSTLQNKVDVTNWIPSLMNRRPIDILRRKNPQTSKTWMTKYRKRKQMNCTTHINDKDRRNHLRDEIDKLVMKLLFPQSPTTLKTKFVKLQPTTHPYLSRNLRKIMIRAGVKKAWKSSQNLHKGGVQTCSTDGTHYTRTLFEESEDKWHVSTPKLLPKSSASKTSCVPSQYSVGEVYHLTDHQRTNNNKCDEVLALCSERGKIIHHKMADFVPFFSGKESKGHCGGSWSSIVEEN